MPTEMNSQQKQQLFTADAGDNARNRPAHFLNMANNQQHMQQTLHTCRLADILLTTLTWPANLST